MTEASFGVGITKCILTVEPDPNWPGNEPAQQASPPPAEPERACEVPALRPAPHHGKFTLITVERLKELEEKAWMYDSLCK